MQSSGSFSDNWTHFKAALKHYWLGCKLLVADVQTTQSIFQRVLQGHPLTRRERKQLIRTGADLFRIVPMSVFIIIPFMEFFLPVALKLFPNMLPSTFQDSLKEEENMKQTLKMRMAIAEYLHDTMTVMAKDMRKKAGVNDNKHNGSASDKLNGSSEHGDSKSKDDESPELVSTKALISFLDSTRSGEAVTTKEILRFAVKSQSYMYMNMYM